MIPTPSLHIFVKESVLMRSLLRVSIHPYRGRTHSALKFLIGDVEIGVVVVTVVEAANGEQVGNPQMKKNGDCKWTVTYNIPGDCHYKISVSVNGVEAKGPFKKVWMSELPPGTKVRRGRDWRWKNQDGGPLGIGEVTGRYKEGWVSVKWGNGKGYNYRWGADGFFDLEIIP